MAGETKAVQTQYLKPRKQLANTGLVVQTFSVTLATSEMELADVVNLGYLPAGVTVVAVGFASNDLDNGTAAVNKITIGSTDVVTGLTNAQAGSVATTAPSVRAIVPLTTTDKTLVSTTFSTAPGTPVSGDIHVSFWYHS
jgi:hypothetical protein